MIREPLHGSMQHPQQLLLLLAGERGIDLCSHPLPPPISLSDMARAAERIHSAIEEGELIGIFGDYDCDGVTATAQLVRFFARRNMKPIVRLPHRVHDGYGLKEHIVGEFLARGVKLLITVDSGMSSVGEVQSAQEQGMDVIVTDHHHPYPEVPPAFAIVHPLLSRDFPPPCPSGSGVAYYLLRALEGDDWEGKGEDLCLAMLGTVGDVMELTGPNRTLVTEGLRALSTLAARPIGQLCALAGVDCAHALSTDISFRIAPRINAAGRLDDPTIALQALLFGGTQIAQLEELNRERQQLTETLLQQTLSMLGLGEDIQLEDVPPILVAAHEEFSEGIVGLIAGKLTERFGRPSLVACIRGETCHASLRSTRAYHIAQGLERVQDLLTYYGGHSQAAGCTFPLSHLSSLTDRLSADITRNVEEKELIPALTIDASLLPEHITLRLVEELGRLEPFGEGNPEPRFLLRNVLLSSPRRVGTGGAHLQCQIAGIKAVGFHLGRLADRVNGPVDVVCRLGIDTWNGMRQVQVFVEDVGVGVRQLAY